MRAYACMMMLLSAACLAGCASDPDVLVPKPCVQMSDVDIPTKFIFDPLQSFDFADTSTKERFAVHYFTGKAPFEQLVEFYKQNMPVHGWKLRQEVGSRGLKTLYFKRGQTDTSGAGGSTCIVTVFSTEHIARSIQVIRIEQQ